MKASYPIAVWLSISVIAFSCPAHSQKVPIQKNPKGEGASVENASPAKAPQTFPVAKPFINDYGVEWHPDGAESITLTVSGPHAVYFQGNFPSDTLPYFDFHDEFGNLRPDGVYVYELTVNPQVEVGTYDKMKSVQDSPARSVVVAEMKSTGELPFEPRTQSGSFTFDNHSVIMGEAVNMGATSTGDSDEAGENKDVVHLDDVIIDGSLCTGFDCVNGESFSFDTIRLKENNLRIKFDDTSVAANFPRNDWQLTANESTNGGLNKFSIDDITGGRTPFTVEAGAPSHSLYVENSGDIGLNTNNPVLELHVVAGDSPGIRLEQNGSSGWNPQTWDLSGNETNFFLRDVTNGSLLPFRVRPGSKTSSLEIKDGAVILNEGGSDVDTRIESDHNQNMFVVDAGLDAIGIGTNDIEDWSADYTGLELGANSSMMFHNANGSVHLSNNAYFDGAWKYKIGATKAANYYQKDGEHFLRVAAAGNVDDAVAWTDALHVADNGRVGVNNTNPSALFQVGSGGAVCNGMTWIDGSSRDYKKRIENLSNEELHELFHVLDEIDMVSFLYKQEKDDTPKRIGMIAEEMPEVLASEDHKGLELGRHVGFLMGVVKALRVQNEEMAAELETIKSEMRAMKEAN